MSRSNNPRRPVWLEPFEPPEFPDPDQFDKHGLVAVGADLSSRCLIEAYRAGIFPWYQDPPVLWWSPDPRAVLDPAALHVSRSLRRHLRSLSASPNVQVLMTRDIGEVMHTCGALREASWITPEMERAYGRLGRLGYAMAYEVRRDGELVGGLYGVRLDGLFAAESMFHRETDASKVALVTAVLHQFSEGTTLFDVQFQTPHLESMGTYEVPRHAYLDLLRKAVAPSGAPIESPKAAEPSADGAPVNLLPWVAGRLDLL